MGKRSNYVRRDRDFYPTPYEAVVPLLPHLPVAARFHEPCVGDGDLVRHLERNGHKCFAAGDIKRKGRDLRSQKRSRAATRYGQTIKGFFGVYFYPPSSEQDALKIIGTPADMFITNPPWDRDILHPLITHLSDIAPTWLLFDADWMHTKQSTPYMERCQKIVSVGRIKWITGSKMTGKDNCCWYLFTKEQTAQTAHTEFHGRTA